MKVVISSPYATDSLHGNTVSAMRIAGILEESGHQPELIQAGDSITREAGALIALHARKSHASVTAMSDECQALSRPPRTRSLTRFTCRCACLQHARSTFRGQGSALPRRLRRAATSAVRFFPSHVHPAQVCRTRASSMSHGARCVSPSRHAG